MRLVETSKCPLCELDATFEFRDSKHLEFFHCDTCGDFLICQSAIEWLNKKSSQRKAHFSRLSASLKKEHTILELTADFEVEGLHAEKVPRTKYPE